MKSLFADSLNRRQALGRLTAGTLLSLGLWPGALHAANRSGGRTFRFVVVNDTHCVSPECPDYLTRVARQMRQYKPAFCLHAGDVSDKAERPSLEAARNAFTEAGAPVYYLPGNHDYASQTDRSSYDAAFPGQLNYYITWEGWQIVGLDSTDGQLYEKTSIQPATLAWVRNHVGRLDARKPTILFTHFPLGTGIKMRPLNADALLEPFRDVNVQAVFCGHYHAFTEHPWQSAAVTTNRCCSLKRGNHDGTKEKGYFLCTADNGHVTREFIEFKG